MTKLPSKLKGDTIYEAIFELRFEPEPPNEAVFGLIYPIVMKKNPGLKSVSLALSQLPEAVRNNDEEEPTEIEAIKIPVVKKMVFHFNEPVKLEFS